jgi:hypothetical protein
VHKTSSIKVASGNDADDDTDIGFSEPAIDDGDGPSTSYTNAFRDSAGSDEEL